MIAALAVAALCGAIAEPLRKWTVGSWEVADHGEYCMISSPSLMSGKTSLMFSMGGDGMLLALLVNKTWQMKGTRVNKVRVAVDEQQHGSYPTKVLAPTVVGVDLPMALVPALQDGSRVTMQFDRAIYSFPLSYTRLGLAALQECFQEQSETASTAQSQSNADQAALPQSVPPVVKAETIKEESLSTTPLASDGSAFYQGATNGAEYVARAKEAIEAGAASSTTAGPSPPPKESVEAAQAVEVAASPLASDLTPIQPTIDQAAFNEAQNEARAMSAEDTSALPMVSSDGPVSLGVFIGFLAALILFMAVMVPALRLDAANAKAAASHLLAPTPPSPQPKEAPTLVEETESVPANQSSSPPAPRPHPSEAPRQVTVESAPENVTAAVPDGNRGPAAVAAVGAFIVVLALEVAVVTTIAMSIGRFIHGGPAFLIPPVLAAMWAWRNVRGGAHKRAARAALAAAQDVPQNLADLNREGRFKLVFLSLWLAGYCGYWIVAQPYGYSFREDDAIAFVLWLVLPPLAALGAWKALRWAAQGGHSAPPDAGEVTK